MARKVVGTVTSDVQDKTIIVSVARRVTHRVYKKQFTVTDKFVAHDEKNQAKKGDKVEIKDARPRSKTKTWELVRVINTGNAPVDLKKEVEV